MLLSALAVGTSAESAKEHAAITEHSLIVAIDKNSWFIQNETALGRIALT
jgi:hypothetical protein